MLRFVQSTLLITWELKQSHASAAAPDDCPYVLPSKTIHVVKKGNLNNSEFVGNALRSPRNGVYLLPSTKIELFVVWFPVI